MFYSRAAQKLAEVEDQQLNERRVRLRKICGAAMMLLAICFFMLFWTLDPPEESKLAFLLVLIAVLLLLAAVIILAMIDVRLTRQLRSRGDKQDMQ